MKQSVVAIYPPSVQIEGRKIKRGTAVELPIDERGYVHPPDTTHRPTLFLQMWEETVAGWSQVVCSLDGSKLPHLFMHNGSGMFSQPTLVTVTTNGQEVKIVNWWINGYKVKSRCLYEGKLPQPRGLQCFDNAIDAAYNRLRLGGRKLYYTSLWNINSEQV